MKTMGINSRSRSTWIFFLSYLASCARIAAGDVLNLDPIAVDSRWAAPETSEASFQRVPMTENDPASLSARMANFFVSTSNAYSFNDVYALRGLTNTPIFGTSSVGYYLDDLPLAQPFTFPSSYLGIAGARLYRGPETAFGRVGPAGVLSMRTPANHEASLQEIQASYGSFGSSTVGVRFLSARSPRSDAYVSADWSKRDGYIRNVILNREIDDQNTLSALVRLRYRPSSLVEITALITGLKGRSGVQPLVPLDGPLYQVTRKGEGVTELDAYNGALTVAVHLETGELKSTTSGTIWDLDPYSNTLAFGTAELTNHVQQQEHAINQEVVLSSLPNSTIRWKVGLFGSANHADGRFDRFFGPFPYERSAFTFQNRDVALFGEATFSVSSKSRITTGLRSELSSRAMVRTETAPSLLKFGLKQRSSGILPKLRLDHVIDDQTTLFVAAAGGYKPGGFSAFTGNQNLAQFGPERTQALDLGLVRATLKRHLELTLRGFFYEVNGYQIERSFQTSALADDYLVVNAASARSLGGELELAWRPLPQWTVQASVGVSDVKLRSFVDPFTGLDYSGNHAPFVPSYDGSLEIEHRTTTGWVVGIQASRNGRVYYTEDGNRSFSQRPVTLFGVRFGYDSERFSCYLSGENLGSAEYYSSITAGTNHGTPGSPRRVSLSVKIRL